MVEGTFKILNDEDYTDIFEEIYDSTDFDSLNDQVIKLFKEMSDSAFLTLEHFTKLENYLPCECEEEITSLQSLYHSYITEETKQMGLYEFSESLKFIAEKAGQDFPFLMNSIRM
jgi:hypothetical protein